MSGQRAFAQKLNRRGAAEVRKQVSSSCISEITKSPSGLHLSAQTVPLCDVVEPPNYEQFIYEHQNALERDSVRALLEFPADDVTVEMLRRKVRTIAPVVPEHGAENDPKVRDCVRNYTRDYTMVSRRYAHYSRAHLSCAAHNQRCASLLRERGVQEYEVDMEDLPGADENDSIVRDERAVAARSSWASTIFELRNSVSDQLLSDIFEHQPLDEVDYANGMQRQKVRFENIFSLYPQQAEDEVVERRESPSLNEEHFGSRILVKCMQLKLELEIEPIFATMALYDAREKKKISENFSFDLTQDPVKVMLAAHVPFEDVSSLSRACIFSLTHPSPDVFLVIKLEKVMQQGDISEAAEPYTKDDRNRERLEKTRSNAQFYCERLGKFRMPFAWTAIYLMNIVNGANSLDKEQEAAKATESLGSQLTAAIQSFAGLSDRRSSLANQYDNLKKRATLDGSSNTFIRHDSLERNRTFPGVTSQDKRASYCCDEIGAQLTAFRPVTLTVSSFFKQEADKLNDEDLYKFLADLKRPTNVLKRLKCIPGSLKLDISPAPEEPKYCLTPELYRIDPYPDDKNRPIKEIVEFPLKEIHKPHTTYRNLMFVYPRSLNFTNRQGSARNIAIKVQMMCGEEDHHALPMIFGASSGPEFKKECYTTVLYHNKCPQFYNEIKIKLPARLTDAHHLLFTMFHVSCQKKNDSQPLETPIGYTWLPLLRDGRLLVGDYMLPVSVEKPPPSYSMLHPDVMLPGMKWVDNHKGIFSVDVQAVSSIHTQDEYLDRFLSLCHLAEEQRVPARITDQSYEVDLRRAVGDLARARLGALTRFLTLIFDRLILLLVKPPIMHGVQVNVGQACFEALGQIVKRLEDVEDDPRDVNGRQSLLTSYVHYSCSLPHPDPQMPDGSSETSSVLDLELFSQEELRTWTVSSGYATLGRSSTLTLDKGVHHRSNSDPDLPGTPVAPDQEVAAFNAQGGERSGSFRQNDFNSSLPRVHGRKLVHEELVLQWVVANEQSRELALRNAWFFFELMIKSMGEHLARTDRLFMTRLSRFSERFEEEVTRLVNNLIRDIIDRYNRDYALIRSLNASLAFFLMDCFSLMNRGTVFRFIKQYCKALASKVQGQQDATSLHLLKLDFLRIVCSHEHYVTLNLPFGTPLTPSAPSSPTPSIASSSSQTSQSSTSTLKDIATYAHLSNEYRSQHFLAGLVLADLASALETASAGLQSKAINVLRALMTSHDADARFMDKEVRARVATLYLPVLGVVLDVIEQLHDPIQARNEPLQQQVAMAISGSMVYGQAQADDPQRKGQLNEDDTRNLLICFLWVTRNVDERVLKRWWADMAPQKLEKILEVLDFCVSNFEYKGIQELRNQSVAPSNVRRSMDVKARLEDAILGSGNFRSEMIRRKQSSAGGSGSQSQSGSMERGGFASLEADYGSGSARLRFRKDQTQWRQATDCVDRQYTELDAQVEGNLCAEVALIVLDKLELVIQIAQSSDLHQPLLGKVMRVLLRMLALSQSKTVYENVFATQRSIVSKFPELLFEVDTEQCADLCLRLLRHCSSALGETRSQASASLYLLMRHNFEIGNNFARVKMQVTMSLSSLVGQVHNFNEGFLRKSLKTILTYSEADVELQETSFPDQVRDLVFNLHMILSDTVKMKEYQQDPEMRMDLMYRIARGYQTSPDLRLTWLQNMATTHTERGCHAEAAQCLVHSAGLVAEYLYMLEDKMHLPIGCVSFQNITTNVLEESAVSDDVVNPEEEGICTGKYFTESGLVGLLEQAACSFNDAGLYEAVNEVYKVLTPVYEFNKDFKRLAHLHGKLKDCFLSILKQEGKRMFGTFFRVGFYGGLFGDLDGEEFVYKEPVITKLPEVSHRLENFYSDKFGHGLLEIIKDSRTVEREKLHPEKAYIQITYVEPYFDLWEHRHRQTSCEKNYNIKRFMYATPFTMEGKAHGDLSEQYKRKTILTTSHYFPYVKTRLLVTSREQIILSPIEVAIEDIQKKTRELHAATRQTPPDTKMLQMVLQGCIGTTVNQGPFEIAFVFLSDVTEGKAQSSKHHNKLRISFKDFLKKCSDALTLNASLITMEQKDYQRELDRNYRSVKEQLMPMISNKPLTIKKKTRRDKDRTDKTSRRSREKSS